MKICVPVMKDEGLNSPVADNPRSAPFFLIKDLRYQGFSLVPRDEFIGEGDDLMARLAQDEVKILLSPTLNALALRVWRENGFEVFTIPQTKAQEGISSYLIGLLRKMSGSDTVSAGCGGSCSSCAVEGCGPEASGAAGSPP